MHDTHWNISGALPFCEMLLRRIAPDDWEDYLPRIDLKPCLHDGNLARMLAVGLNEEAVCPEFTYSSDIEESPPAGGAGTVSFFRANSPGRPLLPPVFLIRDSFMILPLNILKGSFTEISAYWTTKFIPAEAIERFVRSEIVIVEVTERNAAALDIRSDAIERILKAYGQI